MTVKLQRTKPYVRVKYVPTSSPAELTATLQKFARARGTDAPEFLEATMYTKDDAVVQAAWYADAPSPGSEDAGKVNGINYFWKPFYYKHVETFVGTDGAEELVPLKHFLHRFTRCAAPGRASDHHAHRPRTAHPASVSHPPAPLPPPQVNLLGD